MQTPILRSLALTAVGNATLRGRDVSGFWPNAALFRYEKQVEFVIPCGGERYDQVAADPNLWFAWLRATGCTGLRMRVAPARQSPRLGHIEEHMLVGFVGGGPRWLIESVAASGSVFWEGFDRVGDRDDPTQRVWLSAYLAADGPAPESAAMPQPTVAGAAETLREALVRIEALAREIPWKADFADDFAHARVVLDGEPSRYPGLDFLDFTDLAMPTRALLAAAAEAWVFGGMGSWNDGEPDPPLAERYRTTTGALFSALKFAVVAVANSTYAAEV